MARPKKAKTDPKAPGAKAAKKAADAAPKKGHNSNGDQELTAAEQQALFLSDKAALATAKGKLAHVAARQLAPIERGPLFKRRRKAG